MQTKADFSLEGLPQQGLQFSINKAFHQIRIQNWLQADADTGLQAHLEISINRGKKNIFEESYWSKYVYKNSKLYLEERKVNGHKYEAINMDATLDISLLGFLPAIYSKVTNYNHVLTKKKYPIKILEVDECLYDVELKSHRLQILFNDQMLASLSAKLPLLGSVVLESEIYETNQFE